jgi:hypothetical protein
MMLTYLILPTPKIKKRKGREGDKKKSLEIGSKREKMRNRKLCKIQ